MYIINFYKRLTIAMMVYYNGYMMYKTFESPVNPYFFDMTLTLGQGLALDFVLVLERGLHLLFPTFI